MSPNRMAVTAGCHGAPPSSRPAAHAALVTALLAAPALAAVAWPGLAVALAYDRAAIARGELWRLATCHWTHWTPDHLAWDLLAFAILVFLGLRAGARRVLAALALATAAIPPAVHALLPGLEGYRGLSGLDSALFVALALLLLRRRLASRSWGGAALYGLALAGFALKIGYELTAGATVFVRTAGFVPVPLAHVVGGLCGAAAALVPWPVRPAGAPTAAVSRAAAGRPARAS